MKTEFITITNKETAAKIVNSKIDAVRVKDIVKKGVRVYENGKIGISGAIGDIPDEELINQAVQNFEAAIEYPYDIESRTIDHRVVSNLNMTSETLLENAEEILAELNRTHDSFWFSEKISISEVTYAFKNTDGLDLLYKDSWFELGLILKEKSSANLFDGFIQYAGRTFDQEAFWAFNHAYLKAYSNKVELPEGDKLPVFMLEPHELLGFLNRSLNGERYATGSSIFSGKIGEKLFNEKINIGQNFNPILTFAPHFDSEGVVLDNDQYRLVENGKLNHVFTDKRTAAEYKLPHTGAASSTYDGIPTLTGTRLRIDSDSKDIKKTLGGKPAIMVIASAGGDFTPDGSFAAPIQVSFLFDGEKIIGKLPEFSIRSHLYKMLGEDYIGTFDNPFYIAENSQLHGFYMTIAR